MKIIGGIDFPPRQTPKQEKFSHKDNETFFIEEIKKQSIDTDVKKAFNEAKEHLAAARKLSAFDKKGSPLQKEVKRLAELGKVVSYLSKKAGDFEDWHIPIARHLRLSEGETRERRSLLAMTTDVFGDHNRLEKTRSKNMTRDDYIQLLADLKKHAVFHEDLSAGPENTFLNDYPELLKKLRVTKTKYQKGEQFKPAIDAKLRTDQRAPAPKNRKRNDGRVIEVPTSGAVVEGPKTIRRPVFEVVPNEPEATEDTVTPEQIAEAEESLWPNAWFSGSELDPEQFYQLMMGAEKADVTTASRHLLEICEEYLAERLGQSDLRDALLIYFRALYGEKELVGMQKRELHQEYERKFHIILNNLLSHKYYSRQKIKYKPEYVPTKDDVAREENKEKWKFRRSAAATAIIVALELGSIGYAIANKDGVAEPPLPPRYELPVRGVGQEQPVETEEARNVRESQVAENTPVRRGLEPGDADEVTRGR